MLTNESVNVNIDSKVSIIFVDRELSVTAVFFISRYHFISKQRNDLLKAENNSVPFPTIKDNKNYLTRKKEIVLILFIETSIIN